MTIYLPNEQTMDVILTKEAVHEEELMKSDSVRLSWDDVSCQELPVGSYITPYPAAQGEEPVRYALFEPYTPEQKSEAQFHYEPLFQHPKMYLGKVAFGVKTSDSAGNDIKKIDWQYPGSLITLLERFITCINETRFIALNNEIVSPTEASCEFGYQLQDFEDKVINVSFSALDILSALNATANVCECEWHIGWEEKTLYFGHITVDRGTEPPVLTAGQNVSIPSTRNSKEGYWNAFEPQGSTRNISRRASSQEFVESDVRLSLDRTTYPDGIIYTDGKGTPLTKAQFEELGQQLFLKPLIFEEVYPKQDMYVYAVCYRERYLKKSDDSNDFYLDANNNKVKYAVWYFRLAIPTFNEQQQVTRWDDFSISEYAVFGVRSVFDVNYNVVGIETDVKYESGMMPDSCTVKVVGNDGTAVSCGCLNESATREYLTLYFYKNQGNADAMIAALNLGVERLELSRGINKDKWPSSNIISQIIDGKEAIVAFQPNTYRVKTGTSEYGIDQYETAEPTLLAGQGSGDGSRHYGFKVRYLGMETATYINQANANPTEEGDTGIVDVISGQRVTVDGNYYELVFEQNETRIMPTTKEQGAYPHGYSKDNAHPSLFANKVNMYNIAVSETFEKAAQQELANTTLNYITDAATDKNSYTVNSNPVAFHESNPQLFIGRKVWFDNGLNPSEQDRTPYRLDTRVMKLVTKLDYPFEQEITVGNEIIKGSQTQVRENVEAIINGNLSVGTGGGVSESFLRTFLENWVTPRFLSKLNNDVAAGHITFSQGFTSVINALFGEYARGQQNTGAKISPEGLGDFITLRIVNKVLGSMTVEDTVKAVNYMLDATNSQNGGVFRSVDRQGQQARKGFTDGYGIYMDAAEGLIETDGLNVRGFMRVMELIINRLQLMDSDYSFTEGDTVEHVDYVDYGVRDGIDRGVHLILTMHKDHDNDYTPFYPGDILYGIVNDLLPNGQVPDGHTATYNGSYYHVWMKVDSVDLTTNQITVTLYDGQESDGTAIVQGGANFTPRGTKITKGNEDANSVLREECDILVDPEDPYSDTLLDTGYDIKLNLTRRGNVADGIDPETGQQSSSILQSQRGRQQSWVLSTTDKRLSFFWNVDTPIIRDDNYALCLGILPDLANLPSTRDRNMPSLYVNTIFFDNSHKANFPAQEVKVDRGAWTNNPTAYYNGSQISDPYHYRHISETTYEYYHAMPAYSSMTREELIAKINNEFKADLETSRVWHNGAIWECKSEGATQTPSSSSTQWTMVSGNLSAPADQTIYKLSESYPWNGTTPTSNANSDTAVPTGWSKDILGVSQSNRYLYASTRHKANGTWGAWSTPVLYARWAEDGTSISIKGTAQAVIAWGTSQAPSSPVVNGVYLNNSNWAPSGSPSAAYIYEQVYTNAYAFKPLSVELGDGYLLNGDFWHYESETATASSPRWKNLGRIQGPKGDDGVDGTSMSIKGNAKGVAIASEVEDDMPRIDGDRYLVTNSTAGYMLTYNAEDDEWVGETASVGDGYIVNGYLWQRVTDASASSRGGWKNQGKFQGSDGENAIDYRLLPSHTSLSFRRTALDELTPASYSVYCGYTKVENDGETAYPGNVQANRHNIGAQNMRIFYRKQKADGTFYSWSDHSMFASSITMANTDYGIEFALSTAIIGSSVNDANIVNRVSISVLRDGQKGDQGATGRMYYPAGNYDDAETYEIIDNACPIVYYSDEYWFLYEQTNLASGGGHVAPSDTSGNPWRKAENFGMVITEALFAPFAKFGSFVVSSDFFISQYGTLFLSSSDSEGTPVNTMGQQYQSKACYTYFRSADPMAEKPSVNTYPKFRPRKVINALTGEEYMAEGNVRIENDDRGKVQLTVEGIIKAKNLFRVLSLCINGATTVFGTDGQLRVINYCNSLAQMNSVDSDFAAAHGIHEGDYTDWSTIHDENDNFNNPVYDGFVQCTGNADIVMLLDPNDGSLRWQDGTRVYIPRPQDCLGKTLEIRHDTTLGNGTAVVLTVDEAANAFALYPNVVNGTIQPYGAPFRSVTIAAGSTILLYSTGTFWLKLNREH